MKFGTDGVRGRANVDLTALDALILGRATARVLSPGLAVVGGDTRVSTPMLEAALIAGLCSEGVEVHRLGVAPTPMVAYLAQRSGGIGAVVSASHNPYQDNGIKLFGPGGTKLTDAIEAAVEAMMVACAQDGGTSGVEPGEVRDGPADAVDAYLGHLLGVLDGRGLDGMRLVVDVAHGAAYRCAKTLFERAGAQVRVLHDTPDGRNINVACGATDPGAVARAVREHGADLGLALDGDADRLIAVDERGEVIDGDRILAMCAVDLRDRGALRSDAVVVTVMSNLGFRRAMQAAGITVVETPVGDRSVLEALDAGRYSLGGEQSGHVIFRDHATTGDGLLTALMLADLVRRSGHPSSALADAAMHRFPQVLRNVQVAQRPAAVAELMAAEIAGAQQQLGDEGRVLIRASGTEPLVRVMVEASEDSVAHEVAERLADAVERRFGATPS